VATRQSLLNAVVCCGLPHHGRGDLGQFRKEFAAIQDKVAGLRRFGSAALDLAYIAAGRFDVYWERNLSPWDFAAGVILVREAGGYVTDLEDKERTMVVGDIIAGNSTLHREVLTLLKDAAK
jgi:myo-inositol-1(or 4)-monophosphatase